MPPVGRAYVVLDENLAKNDRPALFFSRRL
jgi:hypothetical protein